MFAGLNAAGQGAVELDMKGWIQLENTNFVCLNNEVKSFYVMPGKSIHTDD